MLATYFFSYPSVKSELLTQVELDALLATTVKIYEQDQHGVKVAKLINGDFIKIFRVKNQFSIRHFFSYARSFSRNAERLNRLGIPTIKVKQLYHIQNSIKSAVVYEPMLGQTISEALNSKSISITLARNLGTFIAELHEKGIYFRGLHLGNIVITPDNKMGLIDIADMTIFPWPLDCRRRLKNFSRFWRDFENKFKFGYDSIEALIEGYHSNCNKVKVKLADIQKRIM
jgi:tRNA A-37 threonylcarbamoyl transferase component Bud32